MTVQISAEALVLRLHVINAEHLQKSAVKDILCWFKIQALLSVLELSPAIWKWFSDCNRAFNIFISWRIWPVSCEVLKSRIESAVSLQSCISGWESHQNRISCEISNFWWQKYHKKRFSLLKPKPEISETCKAKQVKHWNWFEAQIFF